MSCYYALGRTNDASSQLMTAQWNPTTTTINQYSEDAAVDTRVGLA